MNLEFRQPKGILSEQDRLFRYNLVSNWALDLTLIEDRLWRKQLALDKKKQEDIEALVYKDCPKSEHVLGRIPYMIKYKNKTFSFVPVTE